MFCGKCGAKNNDNAKFCGSCGNTFIQVKKEDVSTSTERTSGRRIIYSNGSGGEKKNTEYREEKNFSQPSLAEKKGRNANLYYSNNGPAINSNGYSKPEKREEKKKEKKGFSWIPIAVAMVLLVLIGVGAFFIYNNRKPKVEIDLNQYVVHTVSGYDGQGEASLEVDWKELGERYGDLLQYNRKAQKSYGSIIQEKTPIEFVQGGIRLEYDKAKELSNGDRVSWSWDLNQDILGCVDCRFISEDSAFYVDELSAYESFDAFAGLTVTFGGNQSEGTVTLEYSGTELSLNDFVSDKEDHLSKGDIVVISLREEAIEKCKNQYGKVPSVTEKSYTVGDLNMYLSSLAEIDIPADNVMRSHAQDECWKAFPNRDGESVKNLVCLGRYLLVPKDGQNNVSGNQLYYVFNVQIKNSFETENMTKTQWTKYSGTNEVYWYARYDNLMLEDGKVSNLNADAFITPSSVLKIDSGLRTSDGQACIWEYTGFSNLSSLEGYVVDSNKEAYNSENDIDKSLIVEITDKPKIETVNKEVIKTVSSSEYIIPESSTVLLSRRDLVNMGLTERQLELARNEIYARHGRMFKDEGLRYYFESCSWYRGTIRPEDFSESYLSDVEKKNVTTISAYENELSSR